MTWPGAHDHALLSAELKLASRLDARFFALLDALQATGSISRAARTAGLSYKGAWLMLDAAGNLAHEPLLHTSSAGTELTDAARTLLAAWHTLQHDHREFLRAQEAKLAQLPALQGLLRRMSMRTTARNQFAGSVSAIELGPVSAQLTIALRGGGEVTAAMTSAAAKRLKLKPGKEVLALIKASAVVLVADFGGWQLSARNQLAGTVSRIERGAVSSLQVGTPATAVFKAYAVMVAAQP